MRGEPDKQRKQADVVGAAAAGLEAEANKLADQLNMLDNEISSQSKKRKEVEEERMQLTVAVERHRSAIENRERHVDEIKKNLELSREEVACT